MADTLLRQCSVSLLPDSSSLLLSYAIFLSFLRFDDEKLIAKIVMQSSERRMCRGGKGNTGRAWGQMDEMSQGREDKCLRSFVMSGDRSPAGTISAAVIDFFPLVLRSTGANTLTCTAWRVLKYFQTEAN